jgi:hypothetical protein
MNKPYRVAESDTGHWRVLLHSKPIGYGALTFKQEIEAEILCGVLNDAHAAGMSLGYDQGQSDAARQRMIGGL